MIPDDLIEQIRLQADIVEVVSEHTRLRRSGKTFRGPCPLHGGEGPNFSVDPSKGFFKCFVCGEGGTVYTFLMRHLGMSYPDAVRHVAARVGVEIPDPREERQAPDPYARFYETNAFAAEWYRERLWKGDEGRVAREYLERRGIGKETAERFGLGWAPAAWNSFREAARAHGIEDEILLELGLAKQPTKGSRDPYDSFRGRLIFPIELPGGRVVGFGGRILGDAEPHVPKYLNSPETPVYHKGDVLYGLAWSRGPIRKAEAALIVEGYMDFVSLAAHGVEHAVAPLGTALSAKQAELIARYARRVILLYDSDAAGLRATFRSADELLRAGVEVLVATLPEGEDPDSLVRARGAKALQKFLDDAVDVMERKIGILDRRGIFGSISGVRRAIDALLPTVRAAADEVTRGVYLTRIAEKTGVPRDTLEREAAAKTRGEANTAVHEPRRGSREPQARKRDTPVAAAARAMGPERSLLLLLMRDESWVERAVREIGPDDFHDPVYRAVFEGLLQADGGRDPEGRWLEVFPPDALPMVEELRGDPEAQHMSAPEQFFEMSIRRILARPFEDRLRELDGELDTASPERQAVLLLEKTEILRTMRERKLLLKPGTLRTPVLPS
ncbi:MAG: DNA primase [Gemmatimonadetes bacterium]|nr:DNA primase [Gemmatimonadota bacterium]